MADSCCIYVNKIMHEVDAITNIVTDVVSDPTLPRSEVNMKQVLNIISSLSVLRIIPVPSVVIEKQYSSSLTPRRPRPR